jgi:hypothetical protein
VNRAQELDLDWNFVADCRKNPSDGAQTIKHAKLYPRN